MAADHVYEEASLLDRTAFRCRPPHRYSLGRGYASWAARAEPPKGVPGIDAFAPAPFGDLGRATAPRHSVLAIADDAEVLRRIHDALGWRYRVLGVSHPDAGLQIVNEQPVHIVLADQQLPAMTGVEFLDRIRLEHAETVRLLLTGQADVPAVMDAVNSGHVYRYVRKPWEPEDLQGILRQAAEHYDLLTRCQHLTHQLRAANEDLKTANAEMIQAYDTTLEGWSRALELRDQETDGHSRRVSELAVRLARAMGMDEAQLVHVRRGALLHDIGKVGIPDSILAKPGPLTDEEWDIMKRHASYGYELLARIPFLQEALVIPHCHHERWDGTGYPRGLKGEEIPLAARVFAVIDVWDALCCDRPYRKAWSEPEARAYIRSLAGTHFDPTVVEVFLRLVV